MPNKTFYITQSNTDSLSSEENQSGLVNSLLNAHYAGKRRVSLNEIGTSPDKTQRFEQLKQAFPPLGPGITVTTETPPNKQYFVGDPMDLKKITATGQTIAPPEYSA